MSRHEDFLPGRHNAMMGLPVLAGAAMGTEAGGRARPADIRPAATQALGVPRMTQLIGANGWPTTERDVSMWRSMGMCWGRDSVGPEKRWSVKASMSIAPGPNDSRPDMLARDKEIGIKSLLLLEYSERWNASFEGETESAPRDVAKWEHYVDATVRKYSKPPYNVTHFQIRNEAAGRLSGGDPQASFWRGADPGADRGRARPYACTMPDHIEHVHIPAARIVRNHGARVVYGGWPEQGGLDTFVQWLEYRSPRFDARMLDWVDYLDTHYLEVDALTPIYERYVQKGLVRGLWQTGIGDRSMNDPHYLPAYFFRLAAWALEHNWDDADKYVSMLYHWDGAEPFHLTRRGNPRTYNASGISLIVLQQTVPGVLRRFRGTVVFGPGASGHVLCSDADIVLLVTAEPGWRKVDIAGTGAALPGRFGVTFVDALTGNRASDDAVSFTSLAWSLSITFRVPDVVNGLARTPLQHLAYLVVTPRT